MNNFQPTCQTTKHSNRAKTEFKKEDYSLNNSTIPQGYDIVNKEYSLQPDMIFGWVPKLNIPNITPFSFDHYTVDNLIEDIQHNINEPKIIYKGQRFSNSLALHQRLMQTNHKMSNINQYQFQYPTKGASISQQYQEIINSVITWTPMHANHPIIFDSDFECGNLDVVVQESACVYQIWMRTDTNTKGHFSWYLFSMSNQKYTNGIKLVFKNFVKAKSLYSQNMRPYIKSTKSFQIKGIDWTQDGQNVSFKRSKEYPKYYELSIDYRFDYQDDLVYICYCIPYSYTNLLGYLNKLQIGTRESLCKSLGGLDIPLISYGQKNPLKPTIVINARIHPGESNGSWLMHEIIQFFENDKNPLAQEIINTSNLILIPMLNPDGVVAGNYRTSFSGKDLNRQFRNNDSLLFPEVEALKNYLKAKLTSPLAAFFDLHGHQIKKNSFLYGPQFEIANVNSIISKAYAKLLAQKTPVFRYEASIFKISQGKITTLRAAVCQISNSPFIYTVETSNGFYYHKEQLKSYQIEKKDFFTLGNSIAQTLKFCLDSWYQKQIQQNKILTKKNLQKLISQTGCTIEELTRKDDDNNSEGLSDSNPSDDDYDEDFTNKLKISILKIRQKICRYFNAPDTLINTTLYRNQNRRENLSHTLNAIQQIKARVSSFNKQFQIRPSSELNQIRKNSGQQKTSPKSKVYKMNTQMISLGQFVNEKNLRERYFQKQNLKQMLAQQKQEEMNAISKTRVLEVNDEEYSEFQGKE